jgi:hypothetical protein
MTNSYESVTNNLEILANHEHCMDSVNFTNPLRGKVAPHSFVFGNDGITGIDLDMHFNELKVLIHIGTNSLMKVTFHDHVCKQHASAFRCGGIHHEFRFQPTLIHAHAHAHDGAMYSELGAQRMRLNKAKKGLPNKKGNCCQPIPAHPDASASKKNAAQDYAASQPIR